MLRTSLLRWRIEENWQNKVLRDAEMLGILLYGMIVARTAANDTAAPKFNSTFKDYLKQFKPSQVWKEIEESNKLKGINASFNEEFQKIIDRIDETDDLLKIKVKNGDPKILLDKNGRKLALPPIGTGNKIIMDKDGRKQFKPPGFLVFRNFDMFTVRNRLVELMKQAIYQARNKMIIMQNIRQKYNKLSLFKMGFLISKTDNACRIFTTFAYKSFKFCTLARMYAVKTYSTVDNLEAHERLLDLWFDVDLLIDLVNLNHLNCLRMLNQVMTNRKNAWKFVD